MMTDDEARQNMTAHEKEITVAEKSNEDTKYVLVPREPTQAMSDAAASTPGQMSYADVYRAMIAAAPALPNSDEVAGMVKRLRAEAQRRLDWRTYCNQAPTAHDEEETFLLKTATLLEALDLALRLRERNARIAELEKQLGEADAELIALVETGRLHAGTYDAYEAARIRKGDHRG